MVWAVLLMLVVALGAGLLAVYRQSRCGGRREAAPPATLRRGIVTGAAAAGLLGAAGLAAALLRSDAGCGNRELAEARSGALRAVMFERSCGATTGFSTQVALVRAGEKLSESGNVFIADGDHGRAPPAPWGGPEASLRWAQGALVVRYDERARIFRKADQVGGTRIRFEAAPAAGIGASPAASRNR